MLDQISSLKVILIDKFIEKKQLQLQNFETMTEHNLQQCKNDENIASQIDQKPLKKLSEFIQFHDIDPQLIWNHSESLSPFAFVQRLQSDIGYSASIQQINQIMKMLPQERSELKIEDFWPFNIWDNHQSQFKKTFTEEKQIKRPKTAFQKKNKTKGEENMIKQSNIISQKNYVSMSMSRGLNKSRNRQQTAEKLLQNQIAENSLDKKWQYLIKVGEINSWIKKKSQQAKISPSSVIGAIMSPQQSEGKLIPQFYKVECQKEDLIIWGKNPQSGAMEQIPLKVFDQRYQAQRKKNIPMEKSKNNMKGTMMMVLEGNNSLMKNEEQNSKEKCLKSRLHEKITQRDQQLNYILLQIMRKKNLLEQQENILGECKINSV